jgi:hypothetical protein
LQVDIRRMAIAHTTCGGRSGSEDDVAQVALLAAASVS